ncbi:MAG: DegT/DnrJ/EryC1/StrS family aminotransferase [Alphaproteobacteria bacterium]|jgi:dTDP-4-amino-4,6-dideoxygalactose transaminase
MTAPLPFIDLQAQYRRLKPAIDARVMRVLEHGKFILGPEVGELEAALSSFCGVRETVTVASGTEALRIPMMGEGIGPGDAVFLPAFTYTATAEVPCAIGAEPVFVDVDPRSYNLDPAALERAIAGVRAEGRLRPRAVVAVDLFGLPADYEAIGETCRREGLFLLADAAQSFGASRGNRRAGALAPVTATSFFPAKPLGAYGDGGAIFTDDPAKAEIYRSIRFHGSNNADRYEIERIGTNGRLDTIQAAILMVKLEAYPAELAHRGAVAARYDEKLPATVRRPAREAGSASAWPLYVVETPRRDAVKAALAAQGIPTAIYYPKPMHFQPAYARYGKGPGSLPVSEALCARVLALPMHSDLDLATVDRICAAVAEALA